MPEERGQQPHTSHDEWDKIAAAYGASTEREGKVPSDSFFFQRASAAKQEALQQQVKALEQRLRQLVAKQAKERRDALPRVQHTVNVQVSGNRVEVKGAAGEVAVEENDLQQPSEQGVQAAGSGQWTPTLRPTEMEVRFHKVPSEPASPPQDAMKGSGEEEPSKKEGAGEGEQPAQREEGLEQERRERRSPQPRQVPPPPIPPKGQEAGAFPVAESAREAKEVTSQTPATEREDPAATQPAGAAAAEVSPSRRIQPFVPVPPSRPAPEPLRPLLAAWRRKWSVEWREKRAASDPQKRTRWEVEREVRKQARARMEQARAALARRIAHLLRDKRTIFQVALKSSVDVEALANQDAGVAEALEAYREAREAFFASVARWQLRNLLEYCNRHGLPDLTKAPAEQQRMLEALAKRLKEPSVTESERERLERDAEAILSRIALEQLVVSVGPAGIKEILRRAVERGKVGTAELAVEAEGVPPQEGLRVVGRLLGAAAVSASREGLRQAQEVVEARLQAVDKGGLLRRGFRRFVAAMRGIGGAMSPEAARSIQKWKKVARVLRIVGGAALGAALAGPLGAAAAVGGAVAGMAGAALGGKVGAWLGRKLGAASQALGALQERRRVLAEQEIVAAMGSGQEQQIRDQLTSIASVVEQTLKASEQAKQEEALGRLLGSLVGGAGLGRAAGEVITALPLEMPQGIGEMVETTPLTGSGAGNALRYEVPPSVDDVSGESEVGQIPSSPFPPAEEGDTSATASAGSAEALSQERGMVNAEDAPIVSQQAPTKQVLANVEDAPLGRQGTSQQVLANVGDAPLGNEGTRLEVAPGFSSLQEAHSWSALSPEVRDAVQEQLATLGEVEVREGDTLWDILRHAVEDRFPTMNSQLREAIVGGIVERLKDDVAPEYLREVGIRSGNPDLILPGDTLQVGRLFADLLEKDIPQEIAAPPEVPEPKPIPPAPTAEAQVTIEEDASQQVLANVEDAPLGPQRTLANVEDAPLHSQYSSEEEGAAPPVEERGSTSDPSLSSPLGAEKVEQLFQALQQNPSYERALEFVEEVGAPAGEGKEAVMQLLASEEFRSLRPEALVPAGVGLRFEIPPESGALEELFHDLESWLFWGDVSYEEAQVLRGALEGIVKSWLAALELEGGVNGPATVDLEKLLSNFQAMHPNGTMEQFLTFLLTHPRVALSFAAPTSQVV